jgi:hypothetical protein
MVIVRNVKLRKRSTLEPLAIGNVFETLAHNLQGVVIHVCLISQISHILDYVEDRWQRGAVSKRRNSGMKYPHAQFGSLYIAYRGKAGAAVRVKFKGQAIDILLKYGYKGLYTFRR